MSLSPRGRGGDRIVGRSELHNSDRSDEVVAAIGSFASANRNFVNVLQGYLPESHLAQLQKLAKSSGRSVAALIREAIGRVWLRPESQGPVALWAGKPKRTSVEHDSIYDEP